ncbi:cellulose binding domain-containing protein [Streptomyces cinereospinus]|uniref:Cellulose binding domain-containing protein n=1 Tax=Streptomyces cinereospinus TaxID=285561 RepID=A0ABV5NA04_9ACTN
MPAGQTSTNGWGATRTPGTGAVTAVHASYNVTTAPNGSVGIGCRASRTGDSRPPTACTHNGTACTAG